MEYDDNQSRSSFQSEIKRIEHRGSLQSVDSTLEIHRIDDSQSDFSETNIARMDSNMSSGNFQKNRQYSERSQN